MLGLLLITGTPTLLSGLKKATGKIATELRTIRHDKKATENNESASVQAAAVALTPEQWERVIKDPVIVEGIRAGNRHFTISYKGGSAS